MNAILSVKDVRCGYQNIEVLHGISFEAKANEKICIIGPNGCGKTTLLRAVGNIIPFQGEIIACGQNVDGAKRKELAKKIAYMNQMNSIYFGYTVYETVMLGRYAYSKGLSDTNAVENKKIVEESMHRTGIYELRDKVLTELSGGQLQRVMLARAFAQTPDIILLDEPMNHLDFKYQIELMEYLNKWVMEGERCILSVLHDFNMAFNFADRILLMNDGEFVINAEKKEFPMEKINEIYKIDVCRYMQDSLAFWGKEK